MIAPLAPDVRFQPGQLVRHVRYGYRGVVVSRDPFCKASDAWYHSNPTQPERNQPWYHVLVHGNATVTYAAQSSLEEDDSGEPIDHPLVDQYFSEFKDGRYIRNARDWPQ